MLFFENILVPVCVYRYFFLVFFYSETYQYQYTFTSTYALKLRRNPAGTVIRLPVLLSFFLNISVPVYVYRYLCFKLQRNHIGTGIRVPVLMLLNYSEIIPVLYRHCLSLYPYVRIRMRHVSERKQFRRSW
jgi:hypothetical protein